MVCGSMYLYSAADVVQVDHLVQEAVLLRLQLLGGRQNPHGLRGVAFCLCDHLAFEEEGDGDDEDDEAEEKVAWHSAKCTFEKAVGTLHCRGHHSLPALPRILLLLIIPPSSLS